MTAGTTIVRLSTLSLLALIGPQPAAAADKVTLTRDLADPTTVVGRVQLRVTPPSAWARLERVEEWRQLFPDIRKLEVKKHEGSYWRLRLDSAIFSCGPHDYEVRLAADRSLDLKILAPGADAFGRLVVLPAAGGSTVEYRLTVRMGRIASWFASEAKLRQKQEALVASYLDALAAAFAPDGRRL